MKERKRTRLKGYDYSQDGYYFVTMCVKKRMKCFGCVEKGILKLNESGEIANACINDLPNHYNCSIHESIIMPNHVHAIIVIRYSLSEIIRGFKTFSSRRIHEQTDNKSFTWQKSFYDHVIRTEKAYLKCREYIQNNPVKWDDDVENKGGDAGEYYAGMFQS